MIGIFDSGVGGMTVARSIEQLLPTYPLLYLGDIAHSPYGPKSAQTIIDCAINNTRFLISKGAKLIVIACNSAASVATDSLRQQFQIPIIEVILPAIEEAARTTKNGRIGLIGTSATIRSTSYETALTGINQNIKIFTKACPLLVPLVEEGWHNKRETKMILKRYLHSLKNSQLDTLILGCTHYPLLKHLIGPRIGKKVFLIDSSETTAKYLKHYLHQNPHLKPTEPHTPEQNRYYITDYNDTAQKVANRIFNRHIDLLLTRNICKS